LIGIQGLYLFCIQGHIVPIFALQYSWKMFDFSFLFIFTYFYICFCFCFDDTKLKFIVIDMILICLSSLLIFFFRYDGCFMVFKKEKGIMNEKESDQEGVIKVIRYSKCFISSKEFICTNTFADQDRTFIRLCNHH
jgi:hypothetical protein